MERKNADILIAGGGVAGLTAAAAFGAAGFAVVIVDPAPPVTDAHSDGADLRTTAFLQPAQAFLAKAGIWPRLAGDATPLQIMRIIDAAAHPPVLRDFDASDISDLPFGWNLPNWLLRREIVARLHDLPNVDFRPGTGFAGMVARLDTALVNLTDGTQVNARLVIGADGRASPVRQSLGISATTLRYGQKAVTFAVTHDAPHGNISTEIHRAGGPFTLVPLPDHDGKPCSAVVWMDHGAECLRRAALPPEKFEAEANDRSAWHYGPLKLASKRMVWPIISQIADQITGPRTALVAEAAHVMPPIGAQGLNMSLRDLACLLDLATAKPDDLGAPAMLDSYARQRHPDIRLRVAGIDALNRTSMLGGSTVQDMRARGIAALYGITPVRRTLMQLGLGAG
ncbi:UbiH/UbiF family hydroxylase [Yoonia sp.]|uniref:UbiH/UbiF family hydroxylase n=1 Tax=Yoonia sp. TaxID=2212373 RepID=UPI00391DF907